MVVNTRRKFKRKKEKKKKNACPHFLIFNQRIKNIQKVYPKYDILNKQKFQVLKHFLCFEKETFKYSAANSPKKQVILEVSTVKNFKKEY